MAREIITNWYEAYQEYTERWEPPKIFNKWVALSILSVATQRQVWLQEGNSRLWPNLYVVFVGPSGSGKTSAMREAVPFLDALGIRRSPSKFIHPSQMIVDMVEATKEIEGTGLVTPYMMWAEELPSFLGRDAFKNGVLSDLTTLYDCPEPAFVNPILKRNNDVVPLPYVCMLAGTTPDGIFEVLPPGTVGQGFTSRLIMVSGSYSADRVAEKPWDNVHEQIQSALIHDLDLVSRLKGSMRFSRTAGMIWRDFYDNRKTPEQEFNDPRLQGYASRKPMYVKKISMLLSLAESDSMIVEAYHVEKAIHLLREVDLSIGEIYDEVAPSLIVQHYPRVLKVLKGATGRTMSHSQLMQRFSHSLDKNTFGLVMGGLDEMGKVLKEAVKSGNTNRYTVYYTLMEK